MELLLVRSLKGLLLLFGEDSVVISVRVSLGGQCLALDMITGNYWSAHRLERSSSAAHYVS